MPYKVRSHQLNLKGSLLLKSKSRLIEHLDIQLVIPRGHENDFEEWINEFNDHHDYMVVTPKLKNGTLKINSSDLVDFLGYIDTNRLNEIDLKRIEHDIQNQMQQYIDKTVSPDFRSHYQWCLTAVKNLAWGRHRAPVTSQKGTPDER